MLSELGSKENLQGLALTMATAGLTQGLLDAIPADTATGFLNGVDASSSFGQLMAKNAVQGISSAVLESAVMGTDLEDALKNNLQSAIINTLAAKGANAIGDGFQAGDLDKTSKAIAHALLGCAAGSANAGNSSGCAPGATGAVIGELVAGWYAESSGYDQLKIDANREGASAEIKQQLAVMTNTMTELAKLTGAGGALLIGGDASTMNLAMTTAQNAAQNNRQLHESERSLAQRLAAQSGGKYTAAQIEEQMRLMGNLVFKAEPNTTEALTTTEAIVQNIDQDPGMPKATDGKTIVEVPGQANTTIQQYIIANSTQDSGYIPGVSPYVMSNPTLNKPVTTTGPVVGTATARCANGDLSCISGVGAQQTSLPELTQSARDAIANGASTTSRGAGLVASGATALTVGGSPGVKPIAGTVAIGATVIGAGADAIEQLVQPDLGRVTWDTLATVVQDRIDQRIPLAAPLTNELVEAWRISGTSQALQDWSNRVWVQYLSSIGISK